MNPPPRANSAAARDIAHVLHPNTDLKMHLETGPIVITHGEGVRVFDDTGKGYIEAVSSNTRTPSPWVITIGPVSRCIFKSVLGCSTWAMSRAAAELARGGGFIRVSPVTELGNLLYAPPAPRQAGTQRPNEASGRETRVFFL